MGKIIRRVIGILLAVTAVILICIPASDASATTQRGDFLMDGSTLVSYTGSDTEVTLPNTITAVGKDAFSGNTNLCKIVIPDSVRTIDYAAFENCVNLNTAKIGESVRTIGSSAFSGCKNLTSVNIPEKCDNIGSGVFAGCTSLSNVSIAAGNLYYVCVDGAIYTRDGSILIQYLPGRTSSAYTMPATVNRIGEYAFWGSDSLASVTVSKGVKEIPEYAFSNCNSLGKVVLPTSVESLMAYSFADCPNLKSVAIPDSVGYIDEKAFYLSSGATIQFVSPGGTLTKEVPVSQVEQLEEGTGTVAAATQASASSAAAGDGNVNEEEPEPTPTPAQDPNAQEQPYGYTASYSGDGNWVTLIKDRDFSNNKSSGELGSSMLIGGNAIMLMSSDMPVRGYNIEDAEDEDLMAVSGGNTTGRLDTFDIINGTLAAYNGNEANVTVPDEVNVIGKRAFYKNSDLQGVNISGSVNKIDEFAFARTGISSIDIPDSVTSIDYAAFYHCEDLEDVNIPSSVTNIELGAFDGTKWLEDFKNAKDGNSFLTVGDGILLAYKGEGGNISIPEGTRQIAAGCFTGNTDITGVNIPVGVIKIGEDAFNGCVNLTSLTLPEGLMTIEDRAFCDTGMDAVTIPDSVENIGLGAFDTTGNSCPLKTVLFYGSNVPNVSYKDTATRLSARDLRTDALNGVENVIVQSDCDLDSGTLFDPKYYGFHGQIYAISGSYEAAENLEDAENSGGSDENAKTLDNTADSLKTTGTLALLRTTKKPNDAGIVNIDANVPIANDNYVMDGVKEHAFDAYLNYNEWCDTKPASVNVIGNKSADLDSLLSNITSSIGDKSFASSGITVILSGNDISGSAAAALTDSNEPYTLTISEDESLMDAINAGLYNYYGAMNNVKMTPLELTLYDKSKTIQIHKLGDAKLDVTMPLPGKFIGDDNIKVASLDENGSLTELPTSVSEGNISFVANHCSAYAIYAKSESMTVPASADTALDDSAQNEAGDKVVTVIQSSDNANAGYDLTVNGGVLNTINKKVYNIKARWFVIVILLCLAAVLFLYKPAKKKK